MNISRFYQFLLILLLSAPLSLYSMQSQPKLSQTFKHKIQKILNDQLYCNSPDYRIETFIAACWAAHESSKIIQEYELINKTTTGFSKAWNFCDTISKHYPLVIFRTLIKIATYPLRKTWGWIKNNPTLSEKLIIFPSSLILSALTVNKGINTFGTQLKPHQKTALKLETMLRCADAITSIITTQAHGDLKKLQIQQMTDGNDDHGASYSETIAVSQLTTMQEWGGKIPKDLTEVITAINDNDSNKALLVNMFGVPGTGKTTLAKYCAQAINASYMFKINCGSLLSRWAGGAADRLQIFFDQATEYAQNNTSKKVIIFIDECDIVTRKRSNSDGGIQQDASNTTSKYMACIDTIKEKHPNVTVIEASNFQNFDKAAQSRVDYKIEVLSPNLEQRKKIIPKIWKKQLKVAQCDQKTIDYIAKYTDQFTPRALENLFNKINNLHRPQEFGTPKIISIQNKISKLYIDQALVRELQTMINEQENELREIGHNGKTELALRQTYVTSIAELKANQRTVAQEALHYSLLNSKKMLKDNQLTREEAIKNLRNLKKGFFTPEQEKLDTLIEQLETNKNINVQKEILPELEQLTKNYTELERQADLLEDLQKEYETASLYGANSYDGKTSLQKIKYFTKKINKSMTSDTTTISQNEQDQAAIVQSTENVFGENSDTKETQEKLTKLAQEKIKKAQTWKDKLKTIKADTSKKEIKTTLETLRDQHQTSQQQNIEKIIQPLDIRNKDSKKTLKDEDLDTIFGTALQEYEDDVKQWEEANELARTKDYNNQDIHLLLRVFSKEELAKLPNKTKSSWPLRRTGLMAAGLLSRYSIHKTKNFNSSNMYEKVTKFCKKHMGKIGLATVGTLILGHKFWHYKKGGGPNQLIAQTLKISKKVPDNLTQTFLKISKVHKEESPNNPHPLQNKPKNFVEETLKKIEEIKKQSKNSSPGMIEKIIKNWLNFSHDFGLTQIALQIPEDLASSIIKISRAYETNFTNRSSKKTTNKKILKKEQDVVALIVKDQISEQAKSDQQLLDVITNFKTENDFAQWLTGGINIEDAKKEDEYLNKLNKMITKDKDNNWQVKAGESKHVAINDWKQKLLQKELPNMVKYLATQGGCS